MRVLKFGSALVAAGALVAGFGVVAGTTASADGKTDEEHKVWICHATSGQGELKNGYNLIEVDDDAVAAHRAHVEDNKKFGTLHDLIDVDPADKCGGIPPEATAPPTTAAPTTTVGGETHKVWICHATSGQGELKNGYNLIEVDDDAVAAHRAHVMVNNTFGELRDLIDVDPADKCGGIPPETTAPPTTAAPTASISLDKQVSATQVSPGGSLDYTLIAHNTGALVLTNVVIVDLLPDDVTLASWAIADGAGDCELTVVVQPQVVTCELDDPLPVDGYTKTIVLTVTVDADSVLGSNILNQARVVGYFYRQSDARAEQLHTRRTQAQQAGLSCNPVPEGAVCSLSAVVGSTVTAPVTTPAELGNLVPLPTTTEQASQALPTTSAGGALPITGNGQASGQLLLLGFLLMGFGSVVLLLSRRLANS